MSLERIQRMRRLHLAAFSCVAERVQCHCTEEGHVVGSTVFGIRRADRQVTASQRRPCRVRGFLTMFPVPSLFRRSPACRTVADTEVASTDQGLDHHIPHNRSLKKKILDFFFYKKRLLFKKAYIKGDEFMRSRPGPYNLLLLLFLSRKFLNRHSSYRFSRGPVFSAFSSELRFSIVFL